MRKLLHLLIFMIFTTCLYAQKDSINYLGALPQRDAGQALTTANVTIYPVPVKDNSFTIRADKEISYVRITNIIGQDIYKTRFESPDPQLRIVLDNPKRGMYLVTIMFSDGTRIVKKILVEQSE
jgi:hypothetical protein